MTMLSHSPSPSLSTAPRRRLSSRRGSVSAPDPFAKHLEIDHKERSSFSTLTIVRVPPQQQQQTDTLSHHDQPSQRRHHNHTRTGSGGRPGAPPPNSGPGRLSFAFSTFAPPGGQAKGERPSSPNSSPTSSPRLRPSSPHRGSFGSNSAGKPRLTAEQLYDVAHRSMTPPPLTLSNGNSDNSMTFTPLPPAVYLPFVDRPSEIAALISTSPTKKLFALLSQTFSRDSANSGPTSKPTLDDIPSDPTRWSYSHLFTFATQATRSIAPDALFVALLRKCILKRSELIWERVKGALGVPPELDIDLDVDFDFDEGGDVFDSSSESGLSSEMEDGGMKAKGHWDGWDAVVESPSVEKQITFDNIDKDTQQEEQFKAQVNAALSGPPRVRAVPMEKSDSSESGQTTIAPTPRERRSPPPQPSKKKTLLSNVSFADDAIPKIVNEAPTPNPSTDTFPVEGDSKGHKKSKSSTSLSRSSSLSAWLGSAVLSEPEVEPTWTESTADNFGSNSVDFGLNPSPEDEDFGGGSPLLGPTIPVDVMSIEPLVASSSSGVLTPGAHPPPLSLEGAEGGLGDIIEGEEEEEDADEAKAKEKANEAIKVQGLRLTLSPTVSAPGSPAIGSPTKAFWSGSGNSDTSSPLVLTRPLSWGSSSRRSSFGANSGSPGLTRTGSSGSLTGMAMQLSSTSPSIISGSFGKVHAEPSGYRYDPVGDRVPGNPLFISSFARLTSGPTLVANNPSLRSRAMPPAPRFSRPPLGIRRGSNTSMSDYAITIASESVGSGMNH